MDVIVITKPLWLPLHVTVQDIRQDIWRHSLSISWLIKQPTNRLGGTFCDTAFIMKRVPYDKWKVGAINLCRTIIAYRNHCLYYEISRQTTCCRRKEIALYIPRRASRFFNKNFPIVSSCTRFGSSRRSRPNFISILDSDLDLLEIGNCEFVFALITVEKGVPLIWNGLVLWWSV